LGGIKTSGSLKDFLTIYLNTNIEFERVEARDDGWYFKLSGVWYSADEWDIALLVEELGLEEKE